MATLNSVLEALRSQMVTLMTGRQADNQGITVTSGIKWPPETAFDLLAKQPYGCLLSVVDRNTAKQATRFFPHRVSTTIYPIGIKSTLSRQSFEDGEQVTITLDYADGSTAVNLNDAVSLAVQKGAIDEGAVASAVVGETLTTLAGKLAAAINARASLNEWVSATSAGAVVTITNTSGQLLTFQSNVGNVQDWSREVGRVVRQLQIVIWTNKNNVLSVLGSLIESWIFDTQSNFGFPVGSQFARLTYQTDYTEDSNVRKDLYARHFIVNVEYGVTKIERAYSVLVGIRNIQSN